MLETNLSWLLCTCLLLLMAGTGLIDMLLHRYIPRTPTLYTRKYPFQVWTWWIQIPRVGIPDICWILIFPRPLVYYNRTLCLPLWVCCRKWLRDMLLAVGCVGEYNLYRSQAENCVSWKCQLPYGDAERKKREELNSLERTILPDIKYLSNGENRFLESESWIRIWGEKAFHKQITKSYTLWRMLLHAFCLPSGAFPDGRSLIANYRTHYVEWSGRPVVRSHWTCQR